MESSRIILYADAGEGVGMGHLFRLYPIFRSISEKDPSAIMLAPLPQCVLEELGANNCLSFSGKPEDIPTYFSTFRIRGMLVDSYRFRNQFFRIREIQKNTWIGFFDDHFDIAARVTFLINASPSVSEIDYNSSAVSHFLLGTPYASIAPEFLNAREHFQVREQIKRVFAALGGTDIKRNLPAVISCLDRIFKDDVEIEIAGMDMQNDIPSRRVKYYPWLSQVDLSEKMSSYDLAILAGGTMLLQSACVGVPTIAWPQTEHQKTHAGNLEKLKVIQIINNIDDLPSYISKFQNMDERKKYSENARALVDGLGAGRIMDFLISLDQIK